MDCTQRLARRARKRMALPATPNIDKLKDIFVKFQKGDSNNKSDPEYYDRPESNRLCQLAEKIVKFLPNLRDTPENETEKQEMIAHFAAIKEFYAKFDQTDIDLPLDAEIIHSSIQIYETVMSISFIFFHEFPQTMRDMTEHIREAGELIENTVVRTGILCCLACLGPCLASPFGRILLAIDQKIGEYNLIAIAEFMSKILEVFCFLSQVDIDFETVESIANAIRDVALTVMKPMRAILSLPGHGRKSKWSPLDFGDFIRIKLNKFEKKAPLVEHSMNTFVHLYGSIEQFEAGFERILAKHPGGEHEAVEGQNLLATSDIIKEQTKIVNQVDSMGRFFQHLETIMTYGVLLFSNEEETLGPILTELDTCCQILDNFNRLHVFYKIACGVKYLSKLSVAVGNIVGILQRSNLKFNTPQEFIAEFQKTYPNLLVLLVGSIVQDNLPRIPGFDKLPQNLPSLPQNLPSVPPEVEKGAGQAINTFKKKFKF